MAHLGFGLAAVLFFLSLHLVFIGIGRPFVAAFSRCRVSFHPRVSMILGVAVVGLLTSILYRFGMSLKSLSSLWAILGACGWAWIFVSRASLGDLREWIVYTAVAVLALLPMLSGGFQFALLQGNHWDTLGYLESALVYARHGFGVVQGWSLTELAGNPLFEAAQGNLGVRPSVHILYGMLSLWFEHYSSQIHLAFLTFLSCQMFFALLELADRLPAVVGARWGWTIAMGAAYVSGFWSQWTLDINAWSHIAALPIAIVLTAVLIDFLRSRPPVEDTKNFWVFVFPLAGLLYLYPELFLFYGGAWGGLILWAVWLHGRERENLFKFVGLGCLVLLIGAILYDAVLKCLFLQTQFVVTTRVSWASYFFAFLDGREGSGTPFEAVLNGLPGLLGFYFLSPGSWVPTPLKDLVKGVMFLFASFCVWSMGRWVVDRWRRRDQRPVGGETFLNVLILILLGEILVFAIINRYWAMGKAYSYLFPLLWAMIPLIWNLERPSVRAVLGIVIVVHFSSGLARVHSARNEMGIHYDLPYPSHQPSSLKSVRWDMEQLFVDASRCRAIEIGVEDEWLQRPLFHALTVWKIPFWRETPIKGSFGQGAVMGPMSLPVRGAPDCKIVQDGLVFRVENLARATGQ